MTLPNFFILGAMKAGTTSLHKYLHQHREVFMSPSKDPHYFSLGDMTMSAAAEKLYPDRVRSREEYLNLFHGVRLEKAIGEVSASYLDSNRAALRIKHLLPNAKLIVVLRDPSDRAHSHFMFNKKSFIEELPTLEKAFQAENNRLADGLGPRFKYLGKGFYHDHLQEYLKLFNREQIKVFLFDDLKSDPMGMLRKIFLFLGVDERFEPDISIRYNVSGAWRNQTIGSILKSLHPLRLFFEKNLPPRFVSMVGRTIMKPEKADPNQRQNLINIYRQDILKLQDLLEKDLSAWLH